MHTLSQKNHHLKPLALVVAYHAPALEPLLSDYPFRDREHFDDGISLQQGFQSYTKSQTLAVTA